MVKGGKLYANLTPSFSGIPVVQGKRVAGNPNNCTRISVIYIGFEIETRPFTRCPYDVSLSPFRFERALMNRVRLFVAVSASTHSPYNESFR